METKYLSDVINYENDIEPYQIIEIYSGVGSGKNYWVEKLASEGKSILFITSRKVTAQAQAKKMSGKRWIDLDALGQEGIGSKKQNLVVVTNAGLEHFVKEKYYESDEKTHIWKYFDLIVLDEAHSLTTDATFTDSPFHVKDFLKWVQVHDERCKIIFMTGTPEPIEWAFSDKTRNGPSFKYLDLYDVCNHVDPKDVYLWPSEWIAENIADELKEGSRIIYFANSITRMETLVDSLIKLGVEEDSIGIAYSGMERRKFPNSLLERKEFIRQHLLNEEKLPQEIKIFLTTNQNKEGVNIKDNDINLMFSESCERSALIQMAGRVRKGVEIFAILYDAEQHAPVTTETEMLVDRYCVDSVREFWKNNPKTNLPMAIKIIEGKFSNIRYSFFKNNFFYYSGRKHGIQQATKDARFLQKCVDEWDWPPLVDNDGSGRMKGQGEICFERWFPYSDVTLGRLIVTKQQGQMDELGERVRGFIETSAYWERIISREEKDKFISDLNSALSTWQYDYTMLGIPYPVKQYNRFLNKFGYQLIEASGKQKGNNYRLTRLLQS